jgi:hypothetical protein
MHAIVLSALRNEQAEFPRLRKTARAALLKNLYGEIAQNFVEKRSLMERPIGIEPTPEPWQGSI